jgi:hypothetical protein
LEELHQHQREQLNRYIERSILIVLEFSEEEIVEITKLQAQKPKLSEQDCSAIVCAQKVKGELLTSDNNLRKFAQAKKMVVRGHLWIFDQLVEHKAISGITAIQKLTELIEKTNPRLGLPKGECETRINKWRGLI